MALAFVKKAPVTIAVRCSVKVPLRELPVAYDAFPALRRETDVGGGGVRIDGRTRNASKIDAITISVTAMTRNRFCTS